MKTKAYLVFLCVGNACRSQMAQAFAEKILSGEGWRIESAGLHPAYALAEETLQVMKEKEIQLSGYFPKPYQNFSGLVYLVCMGPEVVPAPGWEYDHLETWNIQDPVGMPLNFFRQIRDEIQSQVKRLIPRLPQ